MAIRGINEDGTVICEQGPIVQRGALRGALGGVIAPPTKTVAVTSTQYSNDIALYATTENLDSLTTPMDPGIPVAIVANSRGGGSALQATAEATTITSVSVSGSGLYATSQSGEAVNASSNTGHGIRARSGQGAALYIVPSPAGVNPQLRPGVAGEIFVSPTTPAHLYFHNGVSWVQLN